MTCPEMDPDLLLERAAGRLSPEHSARVEQHLLECPECRAVADARKAVWRALDQWPAPGVSGDFDQRLHARIAAENAQPWWMRIWSEMVHALSWKAAVSLAGACAVLLAVLLMRGPLMNPTATPGPASVAAQRAVDIDQVESALDDVDMLNQLGAATPAEPRSTSDSGS